MLRISGIQVIFSLFLRGESIGKYLEENEGGGGSLIAVQTIFCSISVGFGGSGRGFGIGGDDDSGSNLNEGCNWDFSADFCSGSWWI